MNMMDGQLDQVSNTTGTDKRNIVQTLGKIIVPAVRATYHNSGGQIYSIHLGHKTEIVPILVNTYLQQACQNTYGTSNIFVCA